MHIRTQIYIRNGIIVLDGGIINFLTVLAIINVRIRRYIERRTMLSAVRLEISLYAKVLH